MTLLTWPEPTDELSDAEIRRFFAPDPNSQHFGQQSEIFPGLSASCPIAELMQQELEALLSNTELPQQARDFLAEIMQGRQPLRALTEVLPELDTSNG